MIRYPGQTGTTAADLLLQNMTDHAVCLVDLDGRIASWNEGAVRLKGYTGLEAVGRPLWSFYTADYNDEQQVRGALDAALAVGKYEGEVWHARKDGSAFWALVVIYPVYDSPGVHNGYAVVTRDITERRRTEQRLLESERGVRLLIEGVIDYAIYMLDPQGIVTNWNSGAARIKGYTPGEVVGRHFSIFYTDEDRESGLPARALAAAYADGRYEAEGWRVRKDGSRFWANAIVDAVRGEGGELIGFAKITRDITEKRVAQQMLDVTREQLAQAQKMESLGQLTGGIAHDFNNLLTGIMGSLDLLRHRLQSGRYDDAERLTSMAMSSAERAASLTHRMLAFARRQPIDPRPVDANRMVLSMEEMLRRTLGENIELEFAMTDGLWLALCDPGQLENAVLNLVINARDAMPDGGRLTVETCNVSLDDAYAARLRDVAPGQYVGVYVSDTGCGMTPDMIGRAFDPFFTTKPVGMGTGLGLSMVHGFARQSDGFARIYSEPDHGTTVKLCLPRHRGDAPAIEPARSVPLETAFTEASVLLVEDEAAVRELVLEVLRETGYDVTEAVDGPSGLAVLESEARVDLLITDIGLPGLNGRQLVEAARRLRPGLKVLFMTGYAESAAIAGGFLESDMEMITKPFPLDLLMQKVRRMLA